MTIKRLAPFLKEHSIPTTGRDKNELDKEPFYLHQLANKRIAFETSTIIYKQNWAAVLRAVNDHHYIWDPVYGWSAPDESTILELFKKFFKSYINKIIESNVHPVFVLEGKHPKLKNITVEKRSATKNDYIKKIDDVRMINDLDQFKKKLPFIYPPGPKHMSFVIEFFKTQKLEALRAKHESEGVCAYLVNNTKDPYHCQCAYSDDYDIFMYGCKAVIRNIRTAHSNNGGFEITGYTLVDILYTLGFVNNSNNIGPEYEAAVLRFRLFCILCGTDYSENIPGFGPVKVLKFMFENNIHTMEQAIEAEPKYASIPYNDIIETMNNNTIYTPLHEPNEKDSHTKPSITLLSEENLPVKMNISSSGKLYKDNSITLDKRA